MVEIKAVIFDLDGVLCCTDNYHLEAWRKMASSHGLSLPPDFPALTRGVGRRESLDILLGDEKDKYSEEEKENMAREKNDCYCAMIDAMTPSDLSPGAVEILSFLRTEGILTALGSSSRNAGTILDKLGIRDYFDAVVDGNSIIRGKPDPEVFVRAAEKLGVRENYALVVEDSIAGIIASRRGGFMTSALSSVSIPGDVMITASSLFVLLERIRTIIGHR
ncbi:MAG: beta-phosphoglucomutase [Candidatus Ornithospirochaeta sp.]